MFPLAAYMIAAGITNPAPITSDRYYIRRPGSSATFLPHPIGTLGIGRPSHVTVNALGLRGRMPTDSDHTKLLVIGGSTVEDALLNDEDTWCGQLEQRLGPGVWVGNMGRSGTTARHHVIQLRETLPYLPKPDAVLVMCGLNDMLADLGCHGAEREPTMGGCFGAGPGIAEHPDDQVFDVGAQFAAWKERRQRVPAKCWISMAPLPVAGLDAYAIALDGISGIAPVIFITQPTLWHRGMTIDEGRQCYAGGVGSPDKWADPETRWYHPTILMTMLAHYNATMRLVAERLRFPLYDLAALPWGAEDFYDDMHFSARGAEVAAATLAPAVHMRVHP